MLLALLGCVLGSGSANAQREQLELEEFPFIHQFSEDVLWDSYYLRDLGLFVGRRETMKALSDQYRAGNPLLLFDASKIDSPVLISFQVRKDFDPQEDGNVDPASFEWTKDYNNGGAEDYSVDAALIMNLFVIDGISPLNLFGYNPDGVAYHHRLGVEYDRFENDGKRTDQIAYRLEAEFLPWKPFGFYSDTVVEPEQGIEDRMTVGVEYRQDRIADDDSWAIDLSYRPLFGLVDGPDPTYDGWFIGRRNFIGAPKDPKLREKREAEGRLGHSGRERETIVAPMFLQTGPVFTVERADTSALADRGFDDTTYFGRGAWNTSFGLLYEKMVFNYKVVAMQPLNGLSDTFVYQEASVIFTPDANQPLNVTVAYRHGENAPDFGDEDLLTVSLGLQF